MLRVEMAGWRPVGGAKRFVDKVKKYVKFGVREEECKGSEGRIKASDWLWDEKKTTTLEFEPHFSLC